MSEKENINYARLYAEDFKLFNFLFQCWAIYCVFVPFVSIFYKVEISGRENIPKNKKFICAGNHMSYFDPFLTAWATRKPIAYMAKKELFEHPLMAFLLRHLAAFAVNREKLEVSTIKTVKDVMKTEHWNLGIFPQGGIKRNKKIETVNRGFVVIAQMSKTDILPISLIGVEEYNWIPFKGKIVIKIGKLIPYDTEPMEMIDEWGRQIAQMSGYEYISETHLTDCEIAERDKDKISG